jgi:hypothetical protein
LAATSRSTRASSAPIAYSTPLQGTDLLPYIASSRSTAHSPIHVRHHVVTATRSEPACPTGQILGHPSPRQRRSLPLTSLRDSLRLPLTRAGVPGLIFAISRAGRISRRPTGATMECAVHPEVPLTVHPRWWGWVCRICQAAGQSTPQPYPFVPLPPARHDRQTRPEQQLRRDSCTDPVPSQTPNDGHPRQSERLIVPGQEASDPGLDVASVSLKATVRGSSPLAAHPRLGQVTMRRPGRVLGGPMNSSPRTSTRISATSTVPPSRST